MNESYKYQYYRYFAIYVTVLKHYPLYGIDGKEKLIITGN